MMTKVLTSSFVALTVVACSHANLQKDPPAAEAPVGVATLAVGEVAAPAPREANQAKTSIEIEAPVEPAADNTCPDGMVLVEGEYCPKVEHECLEWMDPPTSRYRHFRCARYAHKATCKAKKVHKRFCIDRTERTEADSDLPRHFMSWTSSKKLCESQGARLCKESEWNFACEGEEMRPYPYGWERDSSACNVDRQENIGRIGHLVDHRAPAASNPKCASPFGVQDLSGNVEEWTQADHGRKMGWKEVMKGSWWIPSRHACRQFQVGHNDVYAGAETGTRCCKDAPNADAPVTPAKSAKPTPKKKRRSKR